MGLLYNYMKFKFWQSKKNSIVNFYLASLLVVLMFLFFWLFWNSFQVIHQMGLRQQRVSLMQLLNQRQTLHQVSASDVNSIDSWMTFRYINVVFNLPTSYLSTNLQIVDSRYPNLTLNRYIKTKQLDKLVFINKVKQAVGDYLKAKIAP